MWNENNQENLSLSRVTKSDKNSEIIDDNSRDMSNIQQNLSE